MLNFRFLFGLYCIYRCVKPVSTLSLVAPKQYRVDRYAIYNCDKAHKNEYVIFNKATMKITGGKDKTTYDGSFEILQDINEEIRIQGFLSRCNEKNPTDCEFKRRPFAMPTVCGRSDKEEEFQITNVLHEFMRKIMKEILNSLKPPIVCPVIRKAKYYLNLTLDLAVANFFPLEGSRWITNLEFTIGFPKPQPFICMDTEITVRRSSRRS